MWGDIVTKISVIVPVYNVEKLLPKCLDSLVSQTFKDYEIIVINDGSTDNSQKVIDEYSNKITDKIVKISKENEGQAIARNVGIKKASGEYIMFVDSDDYIDKKTLECCYNKALVEKADVVCFDYQLIDKGILKCTENLKKMSKDKIKNYILSQIGPCFKLIKADLIKNNNLYFPTLRAYEDIAVVPAYALFTKNIVTINEKFYYYVLRSGSTMNQTNYSEKLNDIFYSLENLSNIFIKKKAYDKYKDELEYLYIEHLLHAASLRFLPYEEGKKSLDKICEIMHDKFPNWSKNKYYKKENLRYKIVCHLIYKKKFNLLKKILKIN